MSRKKTYKKSARRANRSLIANAIGLSLIVGIIYLSAQYLLACDSNPCEVNKKLSSADAVKLQEVITNPALEEQIVYYKGMTVSFNRRLHIPNWVAWELTGDEADGTEPRYDKFSADESVDGCPDTWDYSYSGYDRGHMAPAGDMKWDKEAMKQTFYLTNICPQAPDLNRGAWKRLEEKCRVKAHSDSALIVICGPILTDDIREFIGDSRVAVPKRFFKIILSPFIADPTAIAFIMPNGEVPGGMQPCAVTIDSVEAVTGHDFFSSLPDDIENILERQCNFNKWSHVKN